MMLNHVCPPAVLDPEIAGGDLWVFVARKVRPGIPICARAARLGGLPLGL